MRYMTVNIMRVKAGHVANFTDGWKMIVDAHKKADHGRALGRVPSREWHAGYDLPLPVCTQVAGGARHLGPMHAAAGYRDAVGDGGRRQMDQAYQDGIEMTQTMHFRLRPGMSTLPKDWAETDAYWARPPAAPAAATVAMKKK